MTKEQQFFIQTLNDYINNKQTIVPDGIDFDEVYTYAKKHQVGGIFYYQTHSAVFESDYYASISYYVNRNNVFNQIVTDFDRQYFTVKGMDVAECYPVPELRTMGDIDLIVHSEDKEQLHNLMIRKGFVADISDREWCYRKNQLLFEVHDRLVYDIQRKTENQSEYFNNCWSYVKNTKLDWNFHFCYLLFHLRKHFINQGVGFRQFLDIAVVANKVNLDWTYVKEQLVLLDMEKFSENIFSLCNKWFGTTIPQRIELSESFFEETSKIIFENGVFGFDNSTNQKNVTINYIKREGRFGTLNKLIKDIFLPYTKMKTIPAYSYLKSKPWLLPFAWLKRIVSKRKLFNKKRLQTDYFVSPKELEQREEYLNKWGIM